MGHKETSNSFKRARRGLDTTQMAVDEYKARSVWSAWWSLDEKVRRRYFTREERAFITRYGARLDELACLRDNPRTHKGVHFVKVCIDSDVQPNSPRERLWLFVQLVCRYQRSVDRAARADLAEHDAFALRAENNALKAKIDYLERHAYGLAKFADGRGTAVRVQRRVDVAAVSSKRRSAVRGGRRASSAQPSPVVRQSGC